MTQLDKRATVRHRRIATELRKLRETRELTAQEAADQLGWSRPKLNKFETAARRPTVGEVEAMLSLYGCDEVLRLGLLKLTQNIAIRGWWLAYTDVFADTSFFELEDDAIEVRAYQREVIPGILQTDETALALQKISQSGEPAEKQLRRVAARAARRQRLTGPDAPVFHAVIEESVLRRPVGGREVMRNQLRSLLQVATLDHVQVQVVPMDAWEHPGYEGSFMILGFGESGNFDVVHTEGVGNSGYLESAVELAQCRLKFASISKAALSKKGSIELIEGLLAE